MHKNTTTHNTNTRARSGTLDNITGPLQRLLSDVHEQVFKLQEERDEWKIKYMKARESIDKYKKLLEKLSRSEELKEDNKKLIISETKQSEVDELDLEDKREPQRILYNMNKAKDNEHSEYSVIYLSDSEEMNNNADHHHHKYNDHHQHKHTDHDRKYNAHDHRHNDHKHTDMHRAHTKHETVEDDEEQPHDEFELFRNTSRKRRVSEREEDEDTKYGNEDTKYGNEDTKYGNEDKQEQETARRPKKQYKYVAAVRKKEDREQLTGHACEQCAQFYTAIYGQEGAAHATTHVHDHEHEHEHKSKEALIGHVSRHKQLYTPPHTPEGYWDLSFPHTSQGEGE